MPKDGSNFLIDRAILKAHGYSFHIQKHYVESINQLFQFILSALFFPTLKFKLININNILS